MAALKSISPGGDNNIVPAHHYGHPWLDIFRYDCPYRSGHIQI